MRLVISGPRALPHSSAEGRCRRVTAAFNRDGHQCSVGLAAGLMRERGLRACHPRAYERTTTPGYEPVRART